MPAAKKRAVADEPKQPKSEVGKAAPEATALPKVAEQQKDKKEKKEKKEKKPKEVLEASTRGRPENRKPEEVSARPGKRKDSAGSATASVSSNPSQTKRVKFAEIPVRLVGKQAPSEKSNVEGSAGIIKDKNEKKDKKESKERKEQKETKEKADKKDAKQHKDKKEKKEKKEKKPKEEEPPTPRNLMPDMDAASDGSDENEEDIRQRNAPCLLPNHNCSQSCFSVPSSQGSRG